MVSAMRVKSPFSQRALLGLTGWVFVATAAALCMIRRRPHQSGKIAVALFLFVKENKEAAYCCDRFGDQRLLR
jgi:hypothetical protein